MTAEPMVIRCADCGTTLSPQWDDQVTDYQFENALWIGFFGGYGMFTDNLDAEGQILKGSDHEAVLCHDCAHRLCETIPWIKNLIQPELSHSHRRHNNGSLHGHVGWDLPPVPGIGTMTEVPCVCGRPAFPVYRRADGAVEAICTECWSSSMGSGECSVCGYACEFVFYTPNEMTRSARECLFCIAANRDENEFVEWLTNNSGTYLTSESVHALAKAYQATAYARTLQASSHTDEEIATAVYLAHQIHLPDATKVPQVRNGASQF